MKGVGRTPEHAEFFGTLPQGDLLPMEIALRQVLIDWLRAKPGPFPLSEWIDRRIGGEVETRRSTGGALELALRGPGGASGFAGFPPPGPPGVHAAQPANPPPPGPPGVHAAAAANPPGNNSAKGVGKSTDAKGAGKSMDAFFKRLPNDNFGAAEVALRESLFEFLAGWKSQQLATLNDLSNFPGVKKNQSAFLPPEITMSDWIERRIGGEVELHNPRGDSANPNPIIRLTEEGKRLVKEKYQKMVSSFEGKGPSATATATDAPLHVTKEAWFASLPADELLPEELELRQALVDAVANWNKKTPLPGNPGMAPRLEDLYTDVNVRKHRSFIPPRMKMRNWIEKRVGGELLLKKMGNVERLFLAGEEADAEPPQKAETADEFLATLPTDSLSDAEIDLRAAIMEQLDGKQAQLLTDISNAFRQNPDFARRQKTLLPQHVPLQKWVNNRIGGEVEICKDNTGRQIMRLRAEGAEETPVSDAVGDAAQEAWLDELPGDEFKPEECDVRDALLVFLGQWRNGAALSNESECATMQHAKKDNEIAKTSRSLLPRGCPVTLSAWIQRRIGAEVTVEEGSRDVNTIVYLTDNPPAKRRRQS